MQVSGYQYFELHQEFVLILLALQVHTAQLPIEGCSGLGSEGVISIVQEKLKTQYKKTES